MTAEQIAREALKLFFALDLYPGNRLLYLQRAMKLQAELERITR